MDDSLKQLIFIFSIIATIFLAGYISGTLAESRLSQIDVLSGTANYKLIEQVDKSVEWTKVEPYAIDCIPTKYNGEDE